MTHENETSSNWPGSTNTERWETITGTNKDGNVERVRNSLADREVLADASSSETPLGNMKAIEISWMYYIFSFLADTARREEDRHKEHCLDVAERLGIDLAAEPHREDEVFAEMTGVYQLPWCIGIGKLMNNLLTVVSNTLVLPGSELFAKASEAPDEMSFVVARRKQLYADMFALIQSTSSVLTHMVKFTDIETENGNRLLDPIGLAVVQMQLDGTRRLMQGEWDDASRGNEDGNEMYLAVIHALIDEIDRRGDSKQEFADFVKDVMNKGLLEDNDDD